MKIKSVIAILSVIALMFTLVACGGNKPAEENLATDEVAAQEAEIQEETTSGTLNESDAVGVAFTALGIDQAEGVIIYPCPAGNAWDVTITANGDATFFEIDSATGQILKQEGVQLATFATDGATAEQIAQQTDGEGAANDYQAIFHHEFGWGWDVTVAGAGSIKQYHVSPEGVCNLIETVQG